ncbi:MAG: hypothetical protein ACRCXY_11405 [Fusobacteriaceae bacterium]
MFLKELVTDKYQNFVLLYTPERTNAIIRSILLSAKFDITKQETLIREYEELLAKES